MTAATSSRMTPRENAGHQLGMKIGAQKVLEGVICCLANSAGYVLMHTTSLTSPIFAGVSAKEVDNSAGSAGDESCPFWQEGDFEFVFSGTFAQTSVGGMAYASDNQTLRMSATNKLTGCVKVGPVVRYISATRGVVRIRPFNTAF